MMQKNDKMQAIILMVGVAIGHLLPVNVVGPFDISIYLLAGAAILYISEV